MTGAQIRIAHPDRPFAADAVSGCCVGTHRSTLVRVHNRPGLTEIAYRVGDHHRFKASMLAALASADLPGLAGLGTRDDDDFTIALIDAWAAVCEVLTFYNERNIHEAYLTTATERLSVGELARLIGYRLHPGSAAEADLVFTVDEVPAAGAEADLPIPRGTRVQSQPGPDETPQVFETLDDVVARVGWNSLVARASRPVPLAADAVGTWLAGQATGLAVGDPVLAVGTERADPDAAGFDTASDHWAFRRIVAVEPSADLDRTYVRWDEPLPALGDGRPQLYALRGAVSLFGHNAPHPAVLSAAQRQDFGFRGKGGIVSRIDVGSGILDGGLDDLLAPAEFASPSLICGSEDDFGDWDFTLSNPIPLDGRHTGYVAGGWVVLTLPTGLRRLYRIDAAEDDGAVGYALSGRTTRLTLDTDASLQTFEASYRRVGVFGESELLELATTPIVEWVSGDRVELDGAGEQLPEGRRMLALGRRAQIVVTGEAVELTAADTTTRTTPRGGRLTVLAEPTPVPVPFAVAVLGVFTPPVLPGFGVRGFGVSAPAGHGAGAAFASGGGGAGGPGSFGAATGGGGEPTRTWSVRDADGFEGTFASDGSDIAVVAADASAEVVAEVVELDRVESVDPTHDRLALRGALVHIYDRSTFEVHGNVARASHGETITEILGAGDASRPFQRFTLRQSPVTHLIAPTETGVESTLEVRVDGVRWDERADLYRRGPTARVYATALTDDGQTVVQFGDGISGARPGSGTNNIVATARRDLGAAGNVRSGQLSLALDQPLGLRGVTNPLPAVGGADAEKMSDARRNAPIQTLTIGRLVSLTDYRDFALGYPGIAKADAGWVWAGGQRRIVVTIAGDNGEQIDRSGPVHEALLVAYRDLGDPFVQFDLVTFEPVAFDLAMRVAVDDAFVGDDVLAAVAHAIRTDFGFDARKFAEPVARSAIEASAHAVAGVRAVDIARLYRLEPPQSNPIRHDLLAALPGRSVDTTVSGAELLTVTATPFDTLEVM